VLENVMVPLSTTAPLGTDLEARALGWLKTLKIDHLATSFPSALPYGDQRRVEIARALALQPAFLLLDEPAAGMNHDETDDLRRVLTHIRDELGLGIIIVEHDLNLILSLCDKVVVLDRGLMIAAGTPAEVRSDPAVIKAYIGTTDQGGEGAAHA
jgi:branched-chain amino acid transport system permease protein